MNFDLIIVGNELLNGKIQDLNTHFLAQETFKQGNNLRKVHIIGDDEKLYFEALDTAFSHSEIVIITGGLGPTEDDMTKAVLAKYFNKEVTFSEKALELTKKHYERGKRKYNQEKIMYHNIPDGFEVIYNPLGYAPGLKYTLKDKTVFATPGVPSEFQSMLEKEIFPTLPKVTVQIIKHVIIKTWKVSEAKIFHKLCPELWDLLKPFGEVSSLPHLLGVDIGIKITESNQTTIDQKEKEILAVIEKTKLREYIWHVGAESMAEVIIQQAKAKNLKLGFAESCTGGLLASKITDISGSSAVFWGSIVSYANDVKINSLGVSPETLKFHGAVSKETALEMAIGAKEQLGVDIVVTTTGIAGPGGGSEEKPVGTVGIGVASKLGENSELFTFNGNRITLKERFARAALVKLLETIRQH